MIGNLCSFSLFSASYGTHDEYMSYCWILEKFKMENFETIWFFFCFVGFLWDSRLIVISENEFFSEWQIPEFHGQKDLHSSEILYFILTKNNDLTAKFQICLLCIPQRQSESNNRSFVCLSLFHVCFFRKSLFSCPFFFSRESYCDYL